MRFRQPTELSRVMNQILDRLATDRVLTLEFATHEELERALDVLHEVATDRRVGVVITPVTRSQIELCLAYAQAV